MNKKILIDFDGVIHKASRGYQEGVIYDEPTPNCVYSINNLINQGYEVVIFTARTEGDYPNIIKWLKDYGFPELDITNVKPQDALCFIDDRAIRFTNWSDIVKYFI